MSKLKTALKGKQERGSQNPATEAALAEVIAEKTKRLNVDIPQSQYKALKAKATMEDASVTDLVRKWVNEYLSD